MINTKQRMATLMFILLATSLTGCQEIKNLVSGTNQQHPITDPNTATTVNETTIKPELTTTPSYFLPKKGNLTIYFFDEIIFAVSPDGKTMLITSVGFSDPLKVFREIKNLGFSKVNTILLATENTNGLDLLKLKVSPDEVLSDGLVLNSTGLSVDQLYDFGNFSYVTFIVPYDDQKGFSLNSIENTISAKFSYNNKKVILLPNCIAECEDRIGDADLRADIALVNNENSLLFLKKISPKVFLTRTAGDVFVQKVESANAKYVLLDKPMFLTTDGNSDFVIGTQLT